MRLTELSVDLRMTTMKAWRERWMEIEVLLGKQCPFSDRRKRGGGVWNWMSMAAHNIAVEG